jgi:hypothetical protein
VPILLTLFTALTLILLCGCGQEEYWTVRGFLPVSGRPGDSITIYGTFEGYEDEVYFNHDVRAEITFSGQSQKTVIVPEGARTGKITVVVVDYNHHRIVRESRDVFTVLPLD